MKIVHVYKDYYPVLGGIENHIRVLAEMQVERGHDVTVLVANQGNDPGRETLNGVKLIRSLRLVTLASTPLTFTMPWHLWRLHPDMTHLHFPYPLGEVSQLLMSQSRHCVMTYHSDIVRQKRLLKLYEPLLFGILRRVQRILPTSSNYVQTSPCLAEFSYKCTPVSLSTDNTRFYPRMDSSPLINDPPVILFMGRHRHYKGVDTLIRAMKSVNAQLVIGGSGPESAVWKWLATEMGVSEKIIFAEDISDRDLPEFYRSGDIFVLPSNSRAEAFGIVLLEAMASGLPCVTTEVGSGTSFVLQDGETGFVVPPSNPEKLAQVLTQLVEEKELRGRLGAAGRKRIEAHFTPSVMADQIEAIYQEVIHDATPDKKEIPL